MKLGKISPDEITTISNEVNLKGFCFRSGKHIQTVMQHCREDLKYPILVSSWDDLGLDFYMADGGRYRRRRFAAFRVAGDIIRRKPHQPHYQSRDYNVLNGGIQRHFEPILEKIAQHGFMLGLIDICRKLFENLDPTHTPSWHVEAHQFRIEAGEKVASIPTPEGMHRDGVDWVCVVLINRQNISSGVTKISDNQTGQLSQFTLTNPFDTVFLNDKRVHHGVTPIRRLERKHQGYRDVLVVTFRRDSD